MINTFLVDQSIKGWIFDLDGVITNTTEYHYEAWKRLALEEGLDFNREINEHLRGVSRRDSLKIILKGTILKEQKMLSLMERKNVYYCSFIENINESSILPGIVPLLNFLEKSDIKKAIASASNNAEYIVNKLGLKDFFDSLSIGSSVNRGKPAPDLFIHAAGQLHLTVGECIVVEDAKAGIEGAKIAGFKTIGIGPHERIGVADLCISNTSLLYEENK